MRCCQKFNLRLFFDRLTGVNFVVFFEWRVLKMNATLPMLDYINKSTYLFHPHIGNSVQTKPWPQMNSILYIAVFTVIGFAANPWKLNQCIVIDFIYLLLEKLITLTLTITVYRSRAINTMVHMDVLPNKDPVIPYNSQANGPGKTYPVQKIYFYRINLPTTPGAVSYLRTMFRTYSYTPSPATYKTSCKSLKMPNSPLINSKVCVAISSSWKYKLPARFRQTTPRRRWTWKRPAFYATLDSKVEIGT